MILIIGDEKNISSRIAKKLNRIEGKKNAKKVLLGVVLNQILYEEI